MKLFMFGNDLVIKQNDNEFMKLENFMIDRFSIETNNNIETLYSISGEMMLQPIKKEIDFNIRGKSLVVSYVNDTFDYREELIKEIYKDLNKNGKATKINRGI